MAEDKATANYSVEEVEAMAAHYKTSLFPHDRRVAGMLRLGAMAMRSEAKLKRRLMHWANFGGDRLARLARRIHGEC